MPDVKLSTAELDAAASWLRRATGAVAASDVLALPMRGAATYEGVTGRIDAFIQTVANGMAELSASLACSRNSVVTIADAAKQTDTHLAQSVSFGDTVAAST
ncbi:hypothetical protein [Leucobacter chironomi]|uniref:hypothetical protein n=1 Tax=Leucobacter chironomi TaxID=491918 RepID=UPI001267B513|nr:hypothetical protein [Leucobacter chironomi]